MCYVDDVVIATPTLEVLECMKKVGLIWKPSKCEIVQVAIKYFGRMVEKHGSRSDPYAVEAVLTRKSPNTDHQLMSFTGFSNKFREYLEDYADKNTKGNNSWDETTGNAHGMILENFSFQIMKPELCEAPVLGMPTEKAIYVLDLDVCIVAISSRTTLEWKNCLETDSVREYGAPKQENFALVIFVEKHRAYVGSKPINYGLKTHPCPGYRLFEPDF